MRNLLYIALPSALKTRNAMNAEVDLSRDKKQKMHAFERAHTSHASQMQSLQQLRAKEGFSDAKDRNGPH